MKKYLKFKVDNANQVLIDMDTIASVGVGSGATEIDILTNIVGNQATGAAEVLGYRLTFATMTAPQNGVAVNQIIEAIEAAWATSWTNVVTDMTEQIVPALTAVAKDTYVFA